MLGGDLPAARPLTAAGFVEAKHPRHKKGSEQGGQFAPKGRIGSDLELPSEARQDLAEAARQFAAKPDDPSSKARLKTAVADAKQAGAGDQEISSIIYEAQNPKPDVKPKQRVADQLTKAARSKPLARAWEKGSAMGDIEDMTYSTESDAELGRKLREYYRTRTAELGEMSKKTPGA